jgi:hypothetical protein
MHACEIRDCVRNIPIREIYRWYISLSSILMCISQGVHLRGVYLMGAYISWGVHLMGGCISWARLFRGHASQRPVQYLIGMHLIGVHLTDLRLIGLHLIDPHLIGLHLIGISIGLHLQRPASPKACISQARISQAAIS